ncbi:MAG: ABC transporter substrate-binding protein/permease [Planctomycetia bacterium]|nr:ABC transporter substrate-binding protein/permease [Planctomycetia bacterium]
MKPLALIGGLFIVGLSLHLPHTAKGSDPPPLPPLKWGADAEGGAPYVFKDPKDPAHNIGFEVDLAAALARELKREITFTQYDYVSLLPGLERRDFDFAMNGLEVTPDRTQRYRLSRPYYTYKLQLVTRKDDSRFASLDDCKAKRAVVGTLGDTAAQRLLDKQGIKNRIYDGQVEPYADLALGRIDAVLLDLPIAVYYAQPNPKLKFVGEPFAEGHYAIAFRKDQEALAQQVDAAIDRLAAQGELARIFEKWRIPSDIPVQWTLGACAKLLGEAAVTTIEISLASMLVAVALGLVLATMRLYGPAPLRWLAVGYIEFFRGIPVLLFLVFLYYGLPGISAQFGWPVSLEMGRMTAAILGFGLNYAAYEAEIYRAGISAVPHGQWEAAASLGMAPTITFRRIILPQAIRTILPPMTNDFVSLFKDTSVVSVIAVVELTKQYLILSKSSQMYLQVGVLTAIYYLAMSIPLSYLSQYLERKWSKGVR